MTPLCIAAWVAVLITLPIIVLLYITESRHNRIKRLRRRGYTWKQIGARYRVSESTVRRWSKV